MSELDKDLGRIQKKGTSLKIILGLMVMLGISVYLITLLLAKGFTIKITPEQANNSKFVEVISGKGFSLGESVYKFSNSIAIKVGARKYQSKELTLTSDDNDVIELELIPTPGTIVASVIPEDEDTNWRLDGQLVHVGKMLEVELLPGIYELKVNNKFAEPISQQIEVKSEEVNEQIFQLTAIEGLIKLSSIPFGADVEINGQVIGATPINVPVSGGYFDVSIVKDGFEETTETIEVTTDKREISRNYKLEPQKGGLLVNVEPNDGLLLINGLAVRELGHYLDSNKEHHIVYERDGFFPFSQKLILKPGEEKSLNIQLTPEYGKVSINAVPAADIYINGNKVGVGSYTGEMQAVDHIVKIKKTGYRGVSKQFKPTSERISTIEVSLLTEFDARRREGRPLFITSLGIDMAAFSMDAFTMGSPVNEKGRKRHEHQVTVDFSKPVFISIHEITEKQFSAFAPDWPKSENPVSEVSWEDAAVYCNWLSENEGLPLFYVEDKQGNVIGFNKDSKGYRLPTEAEWEWLAKKGNRAASTTYVWGNLNRVPKSAGNFGDESIKGQQTFTLAKYNDGYADVAPVRSFKPDRVGMHDLAGNVSEWVNDFYTHAKPDITKTHVDYLGMTTGVSHVVKGGNYTTGRIDQLRASFRRTETEGSKTIGFRIARYQ